MLTGGDASIGTTERTDTTDTNTSAASMPPTTAPGGTTLPPPPSTTPPPADGPAVQIRRGNPDRMEVAAAGYRYEVMWTIDSLGWKGIPTDQIVTRCLDGAAPGAILLLHVGSGSADGAALPAIIDGLRSRGYGFATVAGVIA